MEKVLCVFAHPDDEAMGPGGTIAKFAKDKEVYLLCATNGNAKASSNSEQLGQIRQKELQQSAKILGIKRVEFLNFDDGELNNNRYQELVEKIEEKVNEYQPETLLTFDINGVTGHLDHIAVALTTSFVFEKTTLVKTLLYFCLSEDAQKKWAKDHFIFVPKGLKVSEKIDISDTWSQKKAAIEAHQSQIKDVEKVLSILENTGQNYEYFRKFYKPHSN